MKEDRTDEMGGRGVGDGLLWPGAVAGCCDDMMLLLLLWGKYLVSWCLMAASWAAGLLDREANTILSS